MIWYYRPYKNPVTRRKYLRNISPLYIITLLILFARYSKLGLSFKFLLPLIPLIPSLIFFTLLILMKPKYCYTDETYLHVSGKKIRKREAKYKPDFKRLVIDVEGEDNKKRRLYFENVEDMRKFLWDVGYISEVI